MAILRAFKNCVVIKPIVFWVKNKIVEKACGYSPLPTGHEQWSECWWGTKGWDTENSSDRHTLFPEFRARPFYTTWRQRSLSMSQVTSLRNAFHFRENFYVHENE